MSEEPDAEETAGDDPNGAVGDDVAESMTAGRVRGTRRDPVAAAAGGTRDLYDIATWEPRSWLDGLSVWIHRTLVRTARAFVVLVALGILIVEFALTGLATIADPFVGLFILLSVVPAFAIAAYLWRADVTMREPLDSLLITFLLGVLLASFAAVLNSLASPAFSAIPIVGLALFFYLVVAPVEETVKWLAVRLYAFRTPQFNAVVDGAVYGAVAGLGFATIENTLYIGQGYLTAIESGQGAFTATLQTATLRTFAGPGHVIYSAFAGYYLGLAKYNEESAGPIAVKGLLIAAIAHGTYNTLVGFVPAIVSQLTGLIQPVSFIGFVIVFDGVLGYVLYRKVARYRRAYNETASERETGEAGGESEDEGEGEFGEPAGDERGGVDSDAEDGSKEDASVD